MKVTNIIWDTDDYEYDENLPSEVNISNEVLNKIKEKIGMEKIDTKDLDFLDEIGNWLSDEYGWCVKGFCVSPFQIVCICPRCGNSTWYDKDEDGAFECAACGELVFTEDMPCKVI